MSNTSNSNLINLKQILVDPQDTDKLESLLKDKATPVVFDVIEPHGNMHLPQAFLKAQLLKNLVNAGFKVVLYIADWISFLHSLLFY